MLVNIQSFNQWEYGEKVVSISNVMEWGGRACLGRGHINRRQDEVEEAIQTRHSGGIRNDQ